MRVEESQQRFRERIEKRKSDLSPAPNLSRFSMSLVALFAVTVAASGQDTSTASNAPDFSHPSTVEDIAREKQNPVSGLRSLTLQNVNFPLGNGTADSFSIQPVWPFRLSPDWRLVTYTIAPIEWLPSQGPNTRSASGLGNILFNGYISPEKPSGSFKWGIGPAVQLPTRTDSLLGSNRLSLGPAALLYATAGPVSGGIVLQNYWSIGGEGSNKVNQGSAQYIAYYNLPKGLYLYSNATITANWLAKSSDRWLVPIGGGIGKVFQIGKGKTFYSASAQGFYNAVRPDPVGDWTVIVQFQIIFSQ